MAPKLRVSITYPYLNVGYVVVDDHDRILLKERNKQPRFLLVGVAHAWDLPVVGTTYFIGKRMLLFY